MSPNPLGQKIFFGVICAAALLVAMLGLFNPAYLASIFTWVDLPPLHARFVGALYAFGAVFMGFCLFARREAEVRWAVQMIGIWTGMLLLFSILNRRAFDFSQLPAWIWFASYTIYPLLSIWLIIRQPQTMQAATLPGPDLDGLARGFLNVQGILFTILAGLLFITPVSMSNLWPWRMSPILAQMYAGPLLAYGLGSRWYSRQDKWLAVRALLPGMLVFSAATLVVSWIHISLFSFAQISDIVWFGWFILATLILAYLTFRAWQAPE